jgi:CRISPR/Cas system type I-B associated protein Csh2 (Cas7 group RAMP superfamily)
MNEKLQILKMLEEGKINASEASELLEAIKLPSEQNQQVTLTEEYRKKYLRIRVFDKNKTKTIVNINLPITLVKAGINVAMKFSPELSKTGLSNEDFSNIMNAIENEIEGEIINIDADDGNTTVKVFIE